MVWFSTSLKIVCPCQIQSTEKLDESKLLCAHIKPYTFKTQDMLVSWRIPCATNSLNQGGSIPSIIAKIVDCYVRRLVSLKGCHRIFLLSRASLVSAQWLIRRNWHWPASNFGLIWRDFLVLQQSTMDAQIWSNKACDDLTLINLCGWGANWFQQEILYCNFFSTKLSCKESWRLTQNMVGSVWNCWLEQHNEYRKWQSTYSHLGKACQWMEPQ